MIHVCVVEEKVAAVRIEMLFYQVKVITHPAACVTHSVPIVSPMYHAAPTSMFILKILFNSAALIRMI